MSLARTIGMVLGLISLFPLAVHACSCAPVAVEEAYAKAPAVFLVTILESKADAGAAPNNGQTRISARYRVDEVFKGSPSAVESLQVQGRPLGGVPPLHISGSCDMPPFVPGEQWVVFAGAEKIVEAKFCGPTRRIRQGEPQLEQLRKLR